jgi:hypothetical protein
MPTGVFDLHKDQRHRIRLTIGQMEINMKYHTLLTQLTIVGAVIIGSGQVLAEGDAIKGEQVYRRGVLPAAA